MYRKNKNILQKKSFVLKKNYIFAETKLSSIKLLII